MRHLFLAWAGWLVMTVLAPGTTPFAGEDEIADPVPPTVEGRTLVFPTHGVRWTLPESSPFEWEDVTAHETRRSGNLASAYATTDAWKGRVRLSVEPAAAPRDMRLPVQAEWLAALGSSSTASFDEEKTRVDYGATLGGVPARVIYKEGRRGDRSVLLEMHEVYLRSLTFAVFAQVEGHQAGGRLGPAVEALITTLHFDDPRPWVPGPFAVKDVTVHDRPRGEDQNVVGEVIGYCFEVVKPVGLASVVRPYHTPKRRITWEAWSEDRSAYVFAGVDFMPWCGSNELRDLAPTYVRRRLAQLKRAWSDLEPKLKRKKSCFPIRYAGHKGLGYEARGSRGGIPYVERGYLVKEDLAFLLVRLQYGGEKAEKVFATPVRAIEKSFEPGDNR